MHKKRRMRMGETPMPALELLNMAIANKQYEGMFLFGPSGADAEKAITIVRGMIEKHAGHILVIKKWDERKLAYEVHKQKRGTYIVAFFTAPGAAIAQIERDVKLSEEVLRVLITSADHLNQTEMAAVEPQPIAPPPERNPWDRDMMGGFNDGPRSGSREGRPPRARRDEPVEAGADKD
jgi:small subunit ribosomal protein S6